MRSQARPAANVSGPFTHLAATGLRQVRSNQEV